MYPKFLAYTPLICSSELPFKSSEHPQSTAWTAAWGTWYLPVNSSILRALHQPLLKQRTSAMLLRVLWQTNIQSNKSLIQTSCISSMWEKGAKSPWTDQSACSDFCWGSWAPGYFTPGHFTPEQVGSVLTAALLGSTGASVTEKRAWGTKWTLQIHKCFANGTWLEIAHYVPFG